LLTIKLEPDLSSLSALLETYTDYYRARRYLQAYRLVHKIHGRKSLHKASYTNLRDDFNLKSQYACNVIADTYKEYATKNTLNGMLLDTNTCTYKDTYITLTTNSPMTAVCKVIGDPIPEGTPTRYVRLYHTDSNEWVLEICDG